MGETIYTTKAGAFAAKKTDGSVVTWAIEQKGPSPFKDPSNRGGDSRSVAWALSSGCVEAIYPAEMAFAAVCDASKLPSTFELQGKVNLTMSKSDAFELLKDLALAKKLLGAAFAAAADLDMSLVTVGKIYVDGRLRGRRLQGLAGSSSYTQSLVIVEFQIAGAKAPPTLKVSKVAAAVESAAKTEGIQVVISKVESSTAGSEPELWQPSLPAGLDNDADDESSSVIKVVLIIIAVCLVIFVIVGICAYCNKDWRFGKSSS